MLGDLDSPRAELLQEVVICMKASEAKILGLFYSQNFTPKKFLWRKWSLTVGILLLSYWQYEKE